MPPEIQKILNWLQDLENRMADLQTCCCSNKIFFVDLPFFEWRSDPDPARIPIQDLLPTQGVCDGAKAILVVSDATIYFTFYSGAGGWSITMESASGRYQCC